MSNPQVALMLTKKAKLSKLKAYRKTAATSNEVHKLVQVAKKKMKCYKANKKLISCENY